MSFIKAGFNRFKWIAFISILTLSVHGQNSALNYQASKNTTLKAILVNGDTIDNFNQDLNAFKVNLPYTTVKSPQITAIPFHSGDIVRIFPASNVLGSKKERTARILVSSKDKAITETYKVQFKVLPKLDLFLLIGQSNMAGRGTLSTEYLDTLTNVYLMTPNNSMEPAINPLNKYSNIRKALKMQQIGPGYEFSKKITAKTGIEIGLIVNARGGSSIKSWEKGNKDQYYEKTLGRMKAALKWGTLKAILWHQGESDSGQPDTYLAKLSTMVQNFRTDLGYPKVYFVAGELAYWRKESKAFNTMIRTISSQIPYSDWVSAEDLTPLINISDPHFNAQSQLLLGERYAEKVLHSCYSK
ncbi:MAG: sialate O-acetylesterase [Paludibacter sp.]|nr:sialate O-acetylesterase [Paludibacter sp.]